MKDIPRFLTLQEVADILRINIRTLYRYIRIKKIKTTRFTKRNFRIAESELERYLKSITK